MDHDSRSNHVESASNDYLGLATDLNLSEEFLIHRKLNERSLVHLLHVFDG